MELEKFSTHIYRLGITIVMIFKIALVGWWPLLARMYEKTDSVLFIRGGISLLEGDWLGAYEYTTLMKGPMMSFWIALTNYLGWPINFAREALYLSACLLALKALSLMCRNKLFLFLFFTFLVFFPASSAYGPLAALFRESIHLPLVLGVQALLIVLFVKYAQSKKLYLYESVLLGVFLLAFFLNREEAVWIYPQLVWFMIGIFGVAWWRYHQANSHLGSMDLLKLLVVPVLIVMVGIDWVSSKNYEEYGVDAVVEINRPEFKLAYKGLISIKPDKPVSSAVLTQDMLQKLVSLPKGGELDVAPLTSRHQVSAMLVPWHFRASTQNAGYYKKGGAAVLEFYEELGKELESACKSGLYECRPVLFGAIPVFDGFWLKVFSAMKLNIQRIMALEGITPVLDGFPSFSDRSNSRNLSLLTSAPIALSPEDRNTLPEYYTKMEKKKTSVLEDILSFYIRVLPTLTSLSMIIFIIAIIRSLRARKIGIKEFIMLSLFGALFIQLVIYSLLSASGLSTSTRLFFNTYPVLVLFIALSLIYAGNWLGEILRFKISERRMH